jgi:hypothetical protein
MMAFLLVCQTAFGQATASISGTVLDKTGSGIVNAKVSVTAQATGMVRNVTTDNTGHYIVPLLPVGVFTVHVDADGFQSAENRNLRLQIDEAREVGFTLEPATVVTTLTVTENTVAVETANPSLGQVITSQEVSQLPLNGRDFVQLATLTAGATAETNPNSFFTSGSDSEVAARGSFSLSVGGSRPNATDWLLDGVDNNELTAGGIGIFSSIDDIQEFKVLTYTYSAEFGNRPGPTVLVTTKGGTNDYHGSLFEFVRNTDLDAKSHFADNVEKFNLNQFGGAFGGPIQKNKTFFFIDGEQKYQRHGIAFAGLIPSLAMRSGDFSADPFGNAQSGLVIVNPNMIGASTNPNAAVNVYFQCDGSGNPLPAASDGSQAHGTACNKIPSNLFNSVGKGLMNVYPKPNANNAADGYNYTNEPVRSLNETKFDVRLDHTFSDKDNGFGRFSYDQAYSWVPGGAPGLAEPNAFGSNEAIRNHARNIAFGESHIFSPTVINQFSVGYNRIFDYILSQGSGTCASAALGIPYANLGCSGGSGGCAPGSYSCGLVSTMLTANYWSLGDRGYSPFQGGTNIYSYKDSLTIIRGRHNLVLGLDYRANQMNVGTEAFQDGFWIIGGGGNFSGYTCPSGTKNCISTPGDPEADLLLGLTGLAIHDQTFGGVVTGRRWKTFRPFAQDDWRVTSSLTLNLGVDWAMTTPITEVNNRLANYIPATGKLLIANQNGVSRAAGVSMDWTAVEPRIGAAWKVMGSSKTVIRAGFAMYHDSGWSQGAQGLWQNPPYLGESDAFPSAGCASANSYCATKLNQTPTGLSLSSGFAPVAAPFTNSNLSSYEGTFYYEPQNLKLGRVRQYNANVERQLPADVVLTAGYAGSRGNHILVGGNDLNTSSPSACGTVKGYTIGCNADGSYYSPNFNFADGTPNYDTISLFGDVGKTNYDSLQLKAETKTPQYGLYALVAYTYSKTYDNGLSDGLGSLLSAPFFPLPNWQQLDWGLSQINLDHSFTASVIYDLPFGKGRTFGRNLSPTANTILGGYQVTVIERISSGFPVPLIDSSNQSGNYFQNGGNGNNWNRPDQLANCNAYAADHSKNQWVNAACFAAPAVGELGDANRVPVTGPGFINTDFSLIKQINLPREGTGLNLRAEFFNLFNHTQYGMPINDISASGFGSVNSTVNNPRLIQLAMKLTF